MFDHTDHRPPATTGAPVKRTHRPFALLLAMALVAAGATVAACGPPEAGEASAGADANDRPRPAATQVVPEPDFTLTADQVHSRWSAAIPPVVRVPPGSVIEA